MTCVSTPHANWMARLRSLRGDERGVAATEFALIFPILVGALILMVDVGSAITYKHAVERKSRLAIEGVLRFGDNKTSVQTFADADGSSAFGSADKPPMQSAATEGTTSAGTTTVTTVVKPTLAIQRYFICRTGDIAVKYTSIPICFKPETWFQMRTSANYTSMVGIRYPLSTTVDVMVKP